jgi:hypothetical protein
MGSKVNVTPERNSLLRHRWFGGQRCSGTNIDPAKRGNACAPRSRDVPFSDAPRWWSRASKFQQQPICTMSSGENSDFEILSGSESDNYAPAKKVCLIALSKTRLSYNV